MYDFPFIV